MPEAEAGKSRGDGKRARRKKEQQEPEAEGESRPPPLPPAGTETSPASYVIEWLCAQPAAGPAEDPPSFHDVYHRHDAERPPSAASSSSSSSSRGQRNGLDSYAQTIRYCGCGGQERPEEPVRLERGPREGGPAAVRGRPGITVAVGDRTVVSRPQPRRAIGCRRSPGQPAGEGGPQAGRAIGCRRSPGQPAGEGGPQAGHAIGCRRSPGQPAGECCPQAVRAVAAAYTGIADVTAGACAGIADVTARADAGIADVTARAHTERREPEPGALLSPARGPGSPGPSPERGRKPQDAAPGRQKTTTPTTEPRRAATDTGDSGPGDGPRLPGGAEVPRRISGGQLPALGNENQDIGGEDLMHQPLGKRLSRAGADKDIHLSGASVPLDKMSTGEVSKWLTDSSFQSCVQRAIGNQCKAIEQQTEEPWAVKDRCSSCGTEKEADTCGAAISLERMTTEEVCKWLTDSGFETYVPYVREFGITGRQLANTDSELFDQLQLQGAEDRERLLFALYQELNPSDMNVEEILGGTDIDNVFSSVELPTDRPGSQDRISGEHLLQANSSYIILEDSAVESMIKNSPVDISYAHQPQQLAPDTPSKLLPSPPAVPEQDQMPLLDQRVLELSQVVEDGLREAGRQVQECDLRKPVDPVLMKDRLGCIQAMMEEVEDNILQIELRQQSCSWEDRNPAKASGEGTALELHLIQQKLALIQLMQQFSQAKTQLHVNNLQGLLQQGRKPLSPLVPSAAQLLHVEVDMNPRELCFSLDIDSSGTPVVTSSVVPVLVEGDRLIEVDGTSARDCSKESLEQMFGGAGTAQILVLRNGEKQSSRSAEDACSLESALKELTNLQSEFITTSVELSALRNEKEEMWAEIEKLRERESLLLQENQRVLQSADSLKQLLERSEYRWMFLKEQLEAMKGAFHLETRKLDTVEARLKEEIEALKQKSCQDDKKIKDLAAALREKSVTSEQLKAMQRQKYQADVKEGSWYPEQLEDLQTSGNQCQGPETQPREWPRSPGQRADCQVSRPASERMATQSQWLDHQACGDQQLLCPAVPHHRDQVYDDGEDNWSCSQGGRCGIRAQRPDQEAGSSRGPGDGHQPHGSQVEAWLDGIERGHRGLRHEGHRWQQRDSSPESDATPRYSNQGQPTGSLPGSEGGFHPGCPFDQQQQPPCQSRGRGQDQQRRRSPQRSSPRVTCPKEDQAAQGGGAGESGRLPPREEERAGGGAGGGAEGRGCRRWRLHQGRARCPQTGLPAEHLLRLSVKLGEPPARAHRKKRASHRSAGKRHPFPEPDFKPNSLSTKLHRDQRTELVLTSQDISKETTAKKKQLAQLLQMVASHTSHLLKGNVLGK